jgi:hypothetical protein
VKALCGPVGSGKSSAAAFEFFFLCTESVVPVRGLVVRESYRQLHDSTERTIREWFGGCSHYNKGDERLKITIPSFAGDMMTHELDFRHCRRPEEVSNLLSTEYAFIWLEEPVPAYQSEGGVIGAGLPQELFKTAMMRQRQRDMHRLEIVLTFNPPSGFHWVYDTFFKPKPEELASMDYALFRCPPFENAVHLPPGYYDRLLATLGEELARRFVLGEVVTIYPGQRVYTQFYEQHHFVEALKPLATVPLILMFDFGLTPCCLIGQTLPNGRFQIYKELQMWSAGIERLGDELHELLKADFSVFSKWRGWADPAGKARMQTDEKTCFQILAAKGFPVQPGAEDLRSRFEAVDQRCNRMIDGGPAILIDRNGCPILMEGLLGGYRYPKSTDGRLARAPLKNKFSHLCNALEYGCSGEFSVTSGEAKQLTKPERLPVFDPFARPRRASGRRTWMSN